MSLCQLLPARALKTIAINPTTVIALISLQKIGVIPGASFPWQSCKALALPC
jgi:hypothetical protein